MCVCECAIPKTKEHNFSNGTWKRQNEWAEEDERKEKQNEHKKRLNLLYV